MYLMYTMYMKYKSGNGREMSVHEVRRTLADVINRVAYAKERISLQRRGRAVAAIIPVEDLELLEKLEDRIDLEAARKALAQARGRKLIPWTKIKAELGL